MIAEAGNCNVIDRVPVVFTPGQSPVWATGNDAALLIVNRCVELLQVLPAMCSGLLAVTEHPKGSDPIATAITGPDGLTAVRSTEVVLVAVSVQVPAVLSDVGSDGAMLFVQLDQRIGFVVPLSPARSPTAPMSASPTLHVIDAPTLIVADPTWVAVIDVPCGSQSAADADETPTSEATSTTPAIMRLMFLMMTLLSSGLPRERGRGRDA
jgi:hypothetical protein